MTTEEYNKEHNPKKLSKTEAIINIVLFVSAMIFVVYKVIVGL